MTLHNGTLATNGNDVLYGKASDYGVNPAPSAVGKVDDLGDIIHGFQGNDVIVGDYFNASQGYEPDSLYGDDGNDWIFGDTANFSYAPLVAAVGAISILVTLDDGTTLNLGADPTWNTRSDTGCQDDIHGGNGDDHLFGSAGSDLLYGDANNDYLDGGTGDDYLQGGTGNDIYIVDNVLDKVDELNGSGSGVDTVYSSVSYSLNTVISATVETLILIGAGAISGTGSNNNNTLHGELNTAANLLAGLLGNDTYVIGAGDTVADTGGIDTLASSTRSLNLSAIGGGQIENAVLRGALALGAIGNNGNNSLDGEANSAANALAGLLGNDTYVIGAGDTVADTGGIDTLASSTRSLNLSAIGGGQIENAVLRGALALSAIGSNGNNSLNGEANSAANALAGLLGNDTYVIGAGDTVADTGGIDALISSTRSLALSLIGGGQIENAFLGGVAGLSLTGSAVNNVLAGNSGANLITGGGGRDVLTGGLGADRFDYNAISESGATAATRDYITDFKPDDVIDLSTIDANGAAAGLGTFVWQGLSASVGHAFTTAVAGQLHYFRVDSVNNLLDRTIIEGDINGDKIVDFQIELNGLFTLTAATPLNTTADIIL